MILETQGYAVKFNESRPAGNSTIDVATATGLIAVTLKEGTNHTGGSDWKSRFVLESAPQA
jgi:hypothetical protein